MESANTDLPPGGITYLVCHDGSNASIEALNFVKQGLLREDKDHLEIAHAWKKEKEEYLSFKFKKDYVKQQNEADFTYLGKKFHYNEVEIEEGQTAK